MDDFDKRRQIEKVFAEHFFNSNVGHLHLGWMVDEYFTLVTQKVLIPSFALLYDKLVEKGHDDKNVMDWGDLDGTFYYIPNEERMVMVYTSQNRDYIIIMKKNPEFYHASHGIHIRRIWRDFDKDRFYDLEGRTKDIMSILDSVETFEEYHDNHSQYPRRPGLDLFKKINFNLDDFQDKPRFYGDIRDPGYVVSYKGSYPQERVDGTSYSFHDIKYFATCYVGSLAYELDVELPVHFE